jgi:hypothetical protein
MTHGQKNIKLLCSSMRRHEVSSIGMYVSEKITPSNFKADNLTSPILPLSLHPTPYVCIIRERDRIFQNLIQEVSDSWDKCRHKSSTET